MLPGATTRLTDGKAHSNVPIADTYCMTDLMRPATGDGSEGQPERSAALRPDVDTLRHAAADLADAQLALLQGDSGELLVGWLNDAALDLLAVEREYVVGHPLTDLEHGIANSRPEWVRLVVDALTPPGRFEPRTWLAAVLSVPFDAAVPVQLRISPVPGVGWIVSLRAVTEAEQVALEAHRELEHRFTALAEHAPVGIILSEAGVRLSYANARFGEIIGHESRELLGTRWLDRIHQADLSNVLESLDEVLDGFPVEVVSRLSPVADSQRWVQLRLSPVTTPRRAAGFIGTVEDITARRAWEDQLAYQAGHDSLTGLINRRRLTETINQLLTSRRRRDREAAVLFCDLDGFKEVNDSLGHDAGDRVLIEVGQRLAAAARSQDMVARIAGDEFVVLVRHVTELSDAEAAAVRQLAALDQPFRVGAASVSISASIGVAMATEFDTASALLHAADRGMYEAKRAGRGLYRVTHPSTPAADS